jgi:zinc protease
MKTRETHVGQTLRASLAASLSIGVLAHLPAAAQARPALDRNVVPPPAATPALVVPKWTKEKLANGAELIVIEKHDLPLVSFQIAFVGGVTSYQSPSKMGLGGLTAAMMSEGTTTKTGEQISDESQLLGTSIGVGIGDESGSIGFAALADKFEPALALLADIMLHPSFPAEALERLRAQRLVALTQSRDQPNAISDNVFARIVYGDHPYGQVPTETTLKAITRDDVINFHRDYFRPGRAVITVTGDITPAAAKAAIERSLAAWPAGGSRASFIYPSLPVPAATTIWLVDKPGAAQSVFALGTPGPSRGTPDYYAISVMNHLLGGLFQSRLNHNIREVKGYSYGVGSSFSFGRGPGAFYAGGDIVTEKTDSALIEFMKELRGVQGGVPFTDDEIKQGKESLIQSLPATFASVAGTGGAVSSLYTQDLPETFYQDYAANINRVTRADLVRVAQRYIDLSHMNIIIVGDRSVIEGPLQALGIAPIVRLDIDGRRVPVP